MPYTLNFTDPTKITAITVPDMPPGINNTDTSLNLIGRGYPNYGQKSAENFLHLLENFAYSSPPPNAIQGQLWFENNPGHLRLFVNNTLVGSNTSTWSPAGGVWQQSIDPASTSTNLVLPGDLWVNTSDNNYILNIRTNNFSWVQCSNTSTGQTGSFSTELFDNSGNAHWVVEHKTLGTVVAIDSADSFYPNPPISNFPFQINTGTTITTLGKFWGTAQAADSLNLYFGNQTYKLTTNEFFIKDDLTLPGPGQIVTGRSFFQHPDGVVVTSQDDPTGSNQGMLHMFKSGSDLVIRNDINSSVGNIVLATDLLTDAGVKVTSVTKSYSTQTGALTVTGGVGVGGDVWIGGDLHYGKNLVIGMADNIFGGQQGQVLYQSTANVTEFTNTGTTGTILVSQGGLAPQFTNTSTIQVGYSANILGGDQGAFLRQTGPNTTGFIYPADISVNTATHSNTLLGGAAGSLIYQVLPNLTGFIPAGIAGQVALSAGENGLLYANTSSITVGYSANLLGGDVNLFPYQTAANTTAFINTGSMQVGYAKNLLGGLVGGIPYQSGANTTAFLGAAGAAGYVLGSTGANSAPSWLYSTPNNNVSTIVARDSNGKSAFTEVDATTISATTVSATNVGASTAVSTPTLQADPTGSSTAVGTFVGNWQLGPGSSIPGPIGLGWGGTTWHTVGNAFNTTYYNHRSYPIAVSASATCAVTSAIQAYVDGQLVSFFQWQFNGCGSYGGAFIIVPSGSSYQLNSGQGVYNWVELY